MPIIRSEIDTILKNEIVKKINSTRSSPILVINKSDGCIRVVADMRKLNKVTGSDSYPLPRVDDLLDIVGQAIFLTKWEFRSVFGKFLSLKGQCSYVLSPHLLGCMPYGLRNASATFQRIMNTVREGLYNFTVLLMTNMCFWMTGNPIFPTIERY